MAGFADVQTLVIAGTADVCGSQRRSDCSHSLQAPLIVPNWDQVQRFVSIYFSFIICHTFRANIFRKKYCVVFFFTDVRDREGSALVKKQVKPTTYV